MMSSHIVSMATQNPPPQVNSTSISAPGTQGLPGQELYLSGGNDGVSWLDAVEVYIPSRGQWATSEPMPLERGYGAAAAIGRQMFVMGGGNGSSWLQSVMMCNLETGAWLEVRHAVAACGNPFAESNVLQSGACLGWGRGFELLEVMCQPEYAVQATGPGSLGGCVAERPGGGADATLPQMLHRDFVSLRACAVLNASLTAETSVTV